MSWPRQVFGFLWRWLTVLLPVAVAVLLAVSGVVDSDFHLRGRKVEFAWILIAVAGMLAAAEAALVTRRQRRLTRLEDEQSELLSRAERAEAWLIRLIRNELISLEAKGHLYSAERVSVFRCDGDRFTLVGRRSRQPQFDLSLGRERYPLEEGVLGRAWADGAAEETGLPSPGPDGQPPRRRWVMTQESRWHVPEAVVEQLVMRSQSYAAFRIEKQERSLGAIVFESTVSAAEAQTAGASSTKRSRAEPSSASGLMPQYPRKRESGTDSINQNPNPYSL
jgi:hypothetical protein